MASPRRAYAHEDVLQQSQESFVLHAKHTTTHSSSLLPGSFTLHLLRHFHVHLEELGNTTVYADTLCLVEVSFPVVGGYALL